MTRRLASQMDTSGGNQNPSSRQIDLLKGWPNTGLLPPQQLDKASEHILSDPNNTDVLGYGPDEGYKPLRQGIAKWLTDFYRPSRPVETERICISGGASQ
ncbi:Valine--pyruvate aminotransferase, partial [Exophiala xenobiotica]